jgi:opacity protein-like surface antigen
MTLKLATFSLGLALAAAAPAIAADWNNGAGGLKDYRASAAVPVPAPIPVYEAPTRWYFRADVGLGLGADPAVKQSGTVLGDTDPAGQSFDASPTWFRPDFETFVNWGLGVGAIISPSWRIDATWDIRSQGTVTANSTYSFIDRNGDPQTGTLYDRTMMRSHVVLFNAYYDFQRLAAFVPYIGAGLGFAVNGLERTSRGEQSDNVRWAEHNTNHDVTIAAAAMVGVTYHLNPSIALDFNYRYMYIGGSESVLTVRGAETHLSISDIHEHQLRAGARLNVY